VHYEDAASMVVAVLERGARGGPEARRVFLAADCSPMMREEICEAALGHPLFKSGRTPEFDGEGPVVVKTYDNSASREELKWSPRWESFADFMQEDAAKRAAEQAAVVDGK
jgi:nucleoside-diphosphate-sugar epimerase